MTTENSLGEKMAVMLTRLDNHDTALSDLKTDQRENRAFGDSLRKWIFFSLLGIFGLIAGAYWKIDEVQKEVSNIRVEIAGMKSDISYMKSDISEIKTNIRKLVDALPKPKE